MARCMPLDMPLALSVCIGLWWRPIVPTSFEVFGRCLGQHLVYGDGRALSTTMVVTWHALQRPAMVVR
jgi:hypothetical protein